MDKVDRVLAAHKAKLVAKANLERLIGTRNGGIRTARKRLIQAVNECLRAEMGNIGAMVG